MSIALDPIMMLRAVNENFMNQVQVIESLYGRFDPHTLGIMGDGEFHDRKGSLMNTMQAYGNLRAEIGETEYLMDMTERQIDAQVLAGDKREELRWRGALRSFDRDLARNQILISLAHSSFAFYRNMALVETFAEPKKRGSFIGITKEKISEMLGKKKPKDEPDLSSVSAEETTAAKTELDAMWDVAADAEKASTIDNVSIV